MKIQSLPLIPPVDARARLMIAALDQFTRRGYAGTSVRELCEAAYVTKPVLYYYFKSKEGLYLKLMEESYARFETILTDLTSFSGTVRQRVIHFCEGLFTSYVEQLSLVKLCYAIYYGPPQGAPSFNLEQYYDRVLDEIKGLVEEGLVQGEIKPGNVLDIVWTITACLSIAIEEQLCRSNPRINGVSMTRMLELVFEGIARPCQDDFTLQRQHEQGV